MTALPQSDWLKFPSISLSVKIYVEGTACGSLESHGSLDAFLHTHTERALSLCENSHHSLSVCVCDWVLTLSVTLALCLYEYLTVNVSLSICINDIRAIADICQTVNLCPYMDSKQNITLSICICKFSPISAVCDCDWEFSLCQSLWVWVCVNT
jgi:hypothetical protein